jgi:two-component system, OmpR family, phosphate regulon sensor histidine kinase PhoR
VDGRCRTFRVTLSCAAAGNEQETGGVVALFQDVTREKEIAQTKSDFVSHVSHELRSPLAGIKGYVEMLLDGDAEDPRTRREFHQIIAAETDRLSRLIDNILNLSRIESGVVKVVKEPQDLTSLVKEVLEVAGPQAVAKGIRLIEQLAPVFAQVRIDRDMMSQAVTNLVSNAIKYTQEGGTVWVSTSVDEGRGVAVFEVRDTGAGIPAEDLPRIFDKFHRVRANSKMAKGTGLGLSLVKQIVEAVHHGRVEVASKVGEGSTFRFELPICG